MKLNLAVVKVFVTALLFLFVLAVPVSAQEGPTLEETTTWIKGKLQTYIHASVEAEHGFGQELFVTKVNEVRGCDLVILATKLTRIQSGGEVIVDLEMEHIYRIALQDLSLNSISLAQDQPIPDTKRSAKVYTLTVQTRNGDETIVTSLRIRMGDSTTTNDSWVSEARFFVDDPQLGERLVKAFRHAAELCGGETEPF